MGGLAERFVYLEALSCGFCMAAAEAARSARK